MVVSGWKRRRLKALCMVSSDISIPTVPKGLRVVVSINPGEHTNERLLPAAACGTVSGDATSIVVETESADGDGDLPCAL